MGLESVLGWFGEIAQWILNFVPRVSMPRYGHVGVLREFSLRPRILRRPFVYLPAWGEVEHVSVLPGLIDLSGQVVSLACGTEMFLDLSAECVVVDPWLYSVEYDDENLGPQALMSTARWTIAAYTREEYVDAEADLEGEILDGCGEIEKRYGLRITRVFITSAAKCRTLRLVN